MRAYIITSEDTTIHFLWHDEGFFQKMKTYFASAEELFRPSRDPSENISCVQVLLSPIIASYMVIKENLDDYLTTISSGEMGCDVVFQEYEDLLYIGFIDHDAFSVSKMEKILVILHSLTGFIFGPCQQNIKPLNSLERARTWSRISQALRSFCSLYEDDQSFLLGCMENLHVNADIQSISSNLVELCIKTIPLSVVGDSCYGVLFVGNKILAQSCLQSFKGKTEITTPDLLHILILMNSKYREMDSTVEASSAMDVFDIYQCNTEGSSLEHAGSPEDSDTNEDSIFYDSLAELMNDSPNSLNYKFTVDLHEMRQRSKSWNGVEKSFYTNDYNHNVDTVSDSLTSPSRAWSHSDLSKVNPWIWPPRPLLGGKNSEETHSPVTYRKVMEVTGNEYKNGNRDLKTSPVFLHVGDCPYSPFVLHEVPIDDQIRLVLLTEMRHGDIATVLCHFLALLRNIRMNDKGIRIEGGQKTIDKLTSCCNQLRSRFKRQAVTEHQIQSIFSLWYQNILGQLQATSSQDESGIRRLEQNISELRKNLQSLFHRLFILKANKSKNQWLPHLSLVQRKIREKLADYTDYLIAKSKRNIGMNWERQRYPGMLHYIFVRRQRQIASTNEHLKHSKVTFESIKDDFLSSTLFIDNFDDNSTDPTLVTILKNRIWKGVMLAQLNMKYTQKNTFSAEDGDFCYTSYVWCDTFESNPPSPSFPTVRSVFPNVDISFAQPFCSDFIQGSTHIDQPSNRSTLLIWELHFVHFSTVTDGMIFDQCKQMHQEVMSNFGDEFQSHQNFSDIFKCYSSKNGLH